MRLKDFRLRFIHSYVYLETTLVKVVW